MQYFQVSSESPLLKQMELINIFDYLRTNISGLISIIASIITGIFVISNSLFPNSEKTVQDFIKLTEDPLQSIQTHFSRLIRYTGHPVVILIDDIDRCREIFVVDFIEGIQTLFRSTNVIFIISADKRWIYSSYEKVYDNFKSTINEPGRPLGSLFLDKIFQTSFSIPKLSNIYKTKFLRNLLNLDERSTQDENSLIEKAQNDVEKLNPKNLLEELKKKRMQHMISSSKNLLLRN